METLPEQNGNLAKKVRTEQNQGKNGTAFPNISVRDITLLSAQPISKHFYNLDLPNVKINFTTVTPFPYFGNPKSKRQKKTPVIALLISIQHTRFSSLYNLIRMGGGRTHPLTPPGNISTQIACS